MDFMDSSYLTGTGNIKLALTGHGSDSATIKQTLSGSGELGVSDGVLSGVDVDAVLRTLETMIRSPAAGRYHRLRPVRGYLADPGRRRYKQ
jgi:hypothetical protein